MQPHAQPNATTNATTNAKYCHHLNINKHQPDTQKDKYCPTHKPEEPGGQNITQVSMDQKAHSLYNKERVCGPYSTHSRTKSMFTDSIWRK